jgi:hypothetical protein
MSISKHNNIAFSTTLYERDLGVSFMVIVLALWIDYGLKSKGYPYMLRSHMGEGIAP